MEVKEHLFSLTGILGFLLPITTEENLFLNRVARKLFAGMGFILSPRTGASRQPSRLIRIPIAAVSVAEAGLVIWFAIY
jgi:hypothetical protein